LFTCPLKNYYSSDKKQSKILKIVNMYSKSLTQQTTLNNRGATETGDPSNGAGRKSYTNRKNKLMSVKGTDVKQT
jgi:hypothetical protein